jgi:hypothetical protein
MKRIHFMEVINGTVNGFIFGTYWNYRSSVQATLGLNAEEERGYLVDEQRYFSGQSNQSELTNAKRSL